MPTSPYVQQLYAQMLSQPGPNQGTVYGPMNAAADMLRQYVGARGLKKEQAALDAEKAAMAKAFASVLSPQINPVDVNLPASQQLPPEGPASTQTMQDRTMASGNTELINALAPGLMQAQAARDQAAQAHQLKLSEPYTLAENQRRMSGSNLIAEGPRSMDAPNTRQVRIGREIVTQEWDKTLGKWNEVGRGEMDKPITISNTPGQGRTQEERYIDYLMNGDPSDPMYAAIYAQMAAPRTSFDAAGRPVMVNPDMSPYRKPASAGGAPQPAPPGAPAPQPQPQQPPGQPTVTVGDPTKAITADRAVAGANIEQAKADIKTAQEMLFPGGKFDRGMAATGAASIPFMGSGVPLTEGREARQAIRRAVEILLRLRTGAAAPDQEVNNYVQMFAPGPLDNDSGAATKMGLLQAFFRDVEAGMAGGGGAQPQQPPPAAGGDIDALVNKWLGGQ